MLTNLSIKAEQNKQILENKLKRSDNFAELVPLLVEVKLNETLLPTIIHCYKDSFGHLWVNRNDLLDWHIQLPKYSSLIYQHHKLYRLDRYPGLSYTLDQYAMQLSVQAIPSIFTLQAFDPYSKRLGALRPNDPGAFINYDGVALRNNSQGLNQTNLSALLGLGLFNRLGVGTANVLAYNKFSNDITTITQPNKLLRLDTTWTLDKPEKIASWRFGDAITGSTYWSGAARFAGIQYATNFNTQPNLVTFPLPGYQGEAAIPSTVDVFVNSVLNQERIVNNGPYTFNNIPVISGAGTVQVVTQDILGRSQVISFPYYTSPLLLKPNLVNFSYEIGFIRNNYAFHSNDYGRPLGVTTYQRGVTDNLTLGTHAEVLLDQQTLGFSANYLLRNYGVASLAVAGSHNSFGEGGLLEVGFVRQGPQLSYGFNTTVASINYLQLGDMPNGSPPDLINQLFLGYSLEGYGSLSASYTMINSRNFSLDRSFSTTPSARLLTGTYSVGLFHNVSLSIGFVGDLRNSKTNQAFITLVLSPDESHVVSNFASWQNHQFLDALQLSKPAPLGTGYGYNVIASNNDNRYAGVDLTVQNEIGSYTARLGKGQGQANYELDASGSAIYFAGNGFLARKLTNSFALIQVPGYSNVDVFYQHQLMGHTDGNGNLLVTELLPYQENIIEIEPTTLPLDTEIGPILKTVTPYFYSGVLAQFPVKHLQGLVVHLLMPNGKFVPVGAEVNLKGDCKKTLHIVGYDGELYLPNVNTGLINGKVNWNEKTYYFILKVPKTTEAIIEMGNVFCY
ncbi:MAG: fimbria/pilus outer membrane usher protein [Rickettsiella sp.]|nr:fimbria/pilus outer membrane usher protein [Rickettsiella sp.]